MSRTILILWAGLSLFGQPPACPVEPKPSTFWLRVDRECQDLPGTLTHYWGPSESVKRTGLALGLDHVLPLNVGAIVLTTHARSALGGGVASTRELAIGVRYAFPAPATWHPEVGLEYGWRSAGSLPPAVQAAGGHVPKSGVARAAVLIQRELSLTSAHRPFARVEWAPALSGRRDDLLGLAAGIRF